MFPIHIYEEGKDLPNDPICYILAKGGIYLKKNLGIMQSLAKVDNISILADLQTTAKMNIPKLPMKAVGETIAFFRTVFETYRSEAVVIIFYHPERKAYKIIAPLQKVSGAGLDYNRDITYEGWDKIGSIHSHADFSAFHSGVDDQDEYSFDGLHITIGHCGNTDGIYTIAASICSNKQRFIVIPEDYIKGIIPAGYVEQYSTSYYSGVHRYQMIDGKLTEIGNTNTPSKPAVTDEFKKKYRLGFNPKYLRFDEEWMKLVTKGSYVYQYGPAYYGNVYGWGDEDFMYGYNHSYPNSPYRTPQSIGAGIDVKNRFSRNVDINAWKSNPHVVVKNGKVHIIPNRATIIPQQQSLPNQEQPIQNVGVKVTPISFPPHDLDDPEINPCYKCMFRENKLDRTVLAFLRQGQQPPVVHNNYVEDHSIQKAKTDGMIQTQLNIPRSLHICPRCKETEYLNPREYKGCSKCHIIMEPLNEPDLKSYYCPECKTTNWLTVNDKLECSICQSQIIEYLSTDNQIEEQMQKDSGELLGQDGDQVEQQVIKDVIINSAKYESSRLLLPTPDNKSIPISQPSKIITIKDIMQACRRKIKGKF
jgi:hypothetical protein